MLHLFLNVGAAPSSGGHILHHAKTLSLNLMKLLLMDYHEYYVYCRLCGLSGSVREDSTKTLVQTGLNEDTMCQRRKNLWKLD